MGRILHAKQITFADVGGSNSFAVPAHQFAGLTIRPAHDRVETYAGTQDQSGERHEFSFMIRRGGVVKVNAFTEVYVGNAVDGSGVYQASTGNPDTDAGDWDSVGAVQVEGAQLEIPAPVTSGGTDQMPFLSYFNPRGYLGLRDLTAAQATLLNARHGLPCDLALKRADGTWLVLKEVYPNVPLDMNTEQGSNIVRGMDFRRMRTRDLEKYAPYLNGDTDWTWFNSRQLADTRIQFTVAMIDDGTESIKFSPAGFTVRPMIHVAESVKDYLIVEGTTYGSTASYITLAPSLS